MKRLIWLWTSLCVLLLSGCGGGGGGNSQGGQQLSREQVEQLVLRNISGIQNLPSVPGGGGMLTRSKGPNGKSGIKTRMQTRSRGSEVYWNPDYELWAVDFMEGDPMTSHTWGTHFYLDEAATQTAGDDVWTSQWGGWPQTDEQELRITGGPWQGLYANTNIVFNEDGRGNEEADGFVPGQGHWEYTMSWIDGGYATIDAKYTDLDSAWTRYQSEPTEDTHRYTITTSAGVKTVMNFDWDYSGTGTITGPSPALPANMVWDDLGDGIITWADGSTTPFSIWEL